MDKKYLKVLLNSVGALLLTIAFFLYAAPFVSLKLGSASNNISGFQLAFDFEGEYCGTEFGSLIILFSLALAFGSFIGSVIGTIMSVLIVMGKELPKNKNAKQLTLEQQKKNLLLTSTISIICSAIPLIINLCVVSITGYSDNPLAHVGGGAIASGILLIIGEGLVFFSNYFTGFLPLNIVLEPNQNKVESNEESSKKEEKSITEQLQELNTLKEQGLISEEDYEAKKKQLLKL